VKRTYQPSHLRTEEDPWISGEDEYQKRPEGFEAKESKGEEKVDRLGERAIAVY